MSVAIAVSSVLVFWAGLALFLPFAPGWVAAFAALGLCVVYLALLDLVCNWRDRRKARRR